MDIYIQKICYAFIWTASCLHASLYREAERLLINSHVSVNNMPKTWQIEGVVKVWLELNIVSVHYILLKTTNQDALGCFFFQGHRYYNTI